MATFIIVIPAKGFSRRLENKNMAPIGGRPMLDYTIDAALRSRRAGDVYVSTDDDTIASHVQSRGVKVIRRGPELGGETPIIDVYRHAWNSLGRPDVAGVVGLQPDHPDRTLDIDDSISRFEASGKDMLVSTEADGTKNGAHYIVSLAVLKGAEPRHKLVVIDDCTNVHTPEDLLRAATRLSQG